MNNNKNTLGGPEIWGGIECTINRTSDIFKDQLSLLNHYERENDLAAFARLGKSYSLPRPLGKTLFDKNGFISWDWASKQLNKLQQLNIRPIVGLIHHGSGPAFTSLMDENFPVLLAEYAGKVAERFPWVEYYTPVNEPLTTARFSGLYGVWFPHRKNDHDFLTMLLNQVEGIILSMSAIRKVNPQAKLVQTEDIGKTHSTASLKYQADFENDRRWLTYDLLCGKVKPGHNLWNYFLDSGINKERLDFFIKNPCIPDIAGFNYYVTSERFLDGKIEKYPSCLIGSNGREEYADNVAVRVIKPAGIGHLLMEAWERYHLPMAITEAHLHCSREDQLRWFKEIWDSCCSLVRKGINIQAVTAWSLLGAYDWDSLLVNEAGHYEVGVFDISGNRRRPTAMVKLIRALSNAGKYEHPLLTTPGWWLRHNPAIKNNVLLTQNSVPVLIIGNGRIADHLHKMCNQRGIYYQSVPCLEVAEAPKPAHGLLLELHKPWAVINATECFNKPHNNSVQSECELAKLLAELCFSTGIPLLTFSTDIIFMNKGQLAHLDSIKMIPSDHHVTKTEFESALLQAHPGSLVIKKRAFFHHWIQNNLFSDLVISKGNHLSHKAIDANILPGHYLHKLVNASLDLLIDEAKGVWDIWHKNLRPSDKDNDGKLTRDIIPEVMQKGRESQGKPQAELLELDN
ncbi:MAG: family 1 glycosylhydrolase [Ferruginibacter sp.]